MFCIYDSLIFSSLATFHSEGKRRNGALLLSHFPFRVQKEINRKKYEVFLCRSPSEHKNAPQTAISVPPLPCSSDYE